MIKRSCITSNNYFLQLEALFKEFVNRFSAHMEKEEQQLFPFIRKMMLAKEMNRCFNRTALNNIEWLIELLNDERAVELGLEY